MKALRVRHLLTAAKVEGVIEDNHRLSIHLYQQALNYWLIDAVGEVSEEEVIRLLEESLKEAGVTRYQIIEHES